MRGHREGRVCKPGREFHQEPQHSVSWSWTSWPPQLWEINFYCYTQSVLFCYGSPCWLIYLSGQFSPTLFWNYDLCIPALCSHSTFFLSLLWLTSHSKYSNIHVNIKKKNYWALQTVQFSSVAQSCPTLWPHESQHARPPCPSPTPRVHSDLCPLSQWCHPAISSSVVPFSSCPQSLPASESFPMSQLFAWDGQSTGVSASISVVIVKLKENY